MSSTNLHQVVFKWPHTEPTTVIVTGTFDEWSSSIRLVKNDTGFEGVTQIPWEQKIKFKFIVDGEWLVHEDQPTEVDPGGFVNNIYTAPAKPVIMPALNVTPLPVEAEKLTAVEANDHGANGNSAVAEVTEKPDGAPQTVPEHTKSLTGTSDTQTSGFPQIISDLASTIAARDGTSSALSYVTSGLGAAMHSAVGIDPINIPKIAIPTPKYNDDFTLPPCMDTVSPTIPEEKAPELSPSPMAPLVPIVIVPVNAAENNTIASSPLPESMHIIPRFVPESSVPDIPDVDDAKVATDTDAPVVVNAPTLVPAETVIKENVAPAVESEAPEEKANRTNPNPAVVSAPHIPEPEPVVEEGAAANAEATNVVDEISFELEAPTEGTNESSPASVIDTLPAIESVIKETASAETEVIPVIDGTPLESEMPVEKLPEPRPLNESSPIQHEDLKVLTNISITPELGLDVDPAPATGSAETTTNKVVPGGTSLDEMKPQEDLFLESNSGKKSTAVEDIEPTLAAIIEAPVDVVEPEAKLVVEAKPEEFSAPEPTDADPVLEQPLTEHAAAEPVEQISIPVTEALVDVVEPPVTKDHSAVNELPVLSETATTPATTAIFEVEPVSKSSVIPVVTGVPASSELAPSLPTIVIEESTPYPKSVVEIIPPTEPNHVTEGPISVPEVKDVQTTASSNEPITEKPNPGEVSEPSVISPESLAVSAAVGVVGSMSTPQATQGSIPATNGHVTPTVSSMSYKEMPTTASDEGIQEFPSSQTDSPSQTPDNSPSSSKFNSVRKKRTSIFGKIKNIFHHDKEKEKK